MVNCRPGCAACCIYISISSSIPGMPHGKKAGERCCNLDEHNFCTIHGRENYPQVCGSLKPDISMCGPTNEAAAEYLINLEKITSPSFPGKVLE